MGLGSKWVGHQMGVGTKWGWAPYEGGNEVTLGINWKGWREIRDWAPNGGWAKKRGKARSS